jgi:hypothetical protein
VHCVFGVIAVFLLKSSSVNVFLPFLAEQPFHLVVRETYKRLHVALCEEKCTAIGDVVPRTGGELERCEKEMESGRISFGRKSRPFQQRVEAHINI